MKKRIYVSSAILSLGLLSACSAETKTEQTPIEQPSSDAEVPSKSEGETLTD